MKKILFFCLLIITGCTKYNDLNDLTIIKSIGISYDNNYHLYAQIIEDIDKDNEPNMKMIETTGESIKDIFNNLESQINKQVFLSHIDLLVLDNNLKTNNYQEIIDYFIANNDFRNDFYCVFSSEIKTLLKESKYDEVEVSLETNEKNITIKNFDNVITDFIDNKKIILPNIKYDEKIIYLGNYKYINEGENA